MKNGNNENIIDGEMKKHLFSDINTEYHFFKSSVIGIDDSAGKGTCHHDEDPGVHIVGGEKQRLKVDL